MRQAFAILSILIMSAFASVSMAETLDLQVGDVVQAKLGSGLVSPRVGGIFLSLNGTTYGDGTCDVDVGPDAVWAGAYLFDIEDSGVLIADEYKTFCMDVVTSPQMGSFADHNVTDGVPAAIKSMWGTYFDGLNSAPEWAAMQLAVWEVMHETNSYDVSSGDFQITGLDTSNKDNNSATLNGLITQANSYLNSSNWTDSAALLMVSRTGKQPFAVEVPEPSVLVLLSLGTLMLLLRRRKK